MARSEILLIVIKLIDRPLPTPLRSKSVLRNMISTNLVLHEEYLFVGYPLILTLKVTEQKDEH